MSERDESEVLNQETTPNNPPQNERRRFLTRVKDISIGLLIPKSLAKFLGSYPDGDSNPNVPLVKSHQITPTELLALLALGGLLQSSSQATVEADANKTIWFTFDDGYVGLGSKIAAVNALQVPSTFFLTGQAIYAYPGDTQTLVNSGHVLGNHTWNHSNLTRQSADGITYQLGMCEDAAQNVVGVSTKRRMRPPYGAVNNFVRNVAANLGYDTILWNWDTRDWAGTSVGYIENNIGPGIVLMHTQGRNTVAALYDIIPALTAQGYNFAVL